jgi:hypothetical protein
MGRTPMIGMSFGRIRKSGHWLLAIDQLQGKPGFSSNIARIDSEPTPFI